MVIRVSTGCAVVASCAALSGCVGVIGGDGGDDPVAICAGGGILPGPAPLRRLTRFEYNKTVRDLLGDTTEPANLFPSEEIGNGFGNDADAQSVSSLLAEKYGTVGEAIAVQATGSPEALAKLAPCAGQIDGTTDAATEEACVRTLVESFAMRAYRRPLDAGEISELVDLHKTIRASSNFATSVASVIEAVLQSPDYLYRVEWGTAEPSGLRRPTAYEMATRLSYFLWGTMPDPVLFEAAKNGELQTAEGVRKHATRMLDDPQARPVIRFFFDNLLPISNLSNLERDEAVFPTYSAQIGSLMRQETQRFLEYEIFEGGGTWQSALTAPYTFVNEPLANYYGISGVQGNDFVKVDVDTTQRLGLLTQAGMVAGTIHSNHTNPVVRGSFIVNKLMCKKIELPTASDILEQVKPPDPSSGKTGRERFSAHSKDPVCKGCHSQMDPIGLAFENYDAVGLWRDTENGETIDASGWVPGSDVKASGPVELVTQIAEAEETQDCFATNWMNFAYGRTLGAEDVCTASRLQEEFASSGYNIKNLLVSLTQTDAFLYLPARKE